MASKEKMAKAMSLDTGKGMCSYSENPMKQPSRTPRGTGPGMNADQKKTNKLLHQAWETRESLRGKSGM